MKTVFSNGSEVAHLWANQAQSHARAGNVSFVGDAFVSYNTTIARILTAPNGQRWAVISSGRWSVSTSRHQSYAVRAASHLPSIRSEWTAYGHGVREWTARTFADCLAGSIARDVPSALRRHDPYWIQRLHAQHAELVAFCHAFGLSAPSFPLNDDDYAQQVATLRARQARKEEIAAKRHAEKRLCRLLAAMSHRGLEIPDTFRTAPACEVPESLFAACEEMVRLHDEREAARDLAEILSEWRAGGRYDWRMNRAPVALRLRRDEAGRLLVETSHGASVLLCQALRLFRLCQATRNAGLATSAEGEARPLLAKVGPYDLRRIDAEGNAQVGCHSLPFAEMERLHASLTPEQLSEARSERAEVVA